MWTWRPRDSGMGRVSIVAQEHFSWSLISDLVGHTPTLEKQRISYSLPNPKGIHHHPDQQKVTTTTTFGMYPWPQTPTSRQDRRSTHPDPNDRRRPPRPLWLSNTVQCGNLIPRIFFSLGEANFNSLASCGIDPAFSAAAGTKYRNCIKRWVSIFTVCFHQQKYLKMFSKVMKPSLFNISVVFFSWLLPTVTSHRRSATALPLQRCREAVVGAVVIIAFQ